MRYTINYDYCAFAVVVRADDAYEACITACLISTQLQGLVTVYRDNKTTYAVYNKGLLVGNPIPLED